MSKEDVGIIDDVYEDWEKIILSLEKKHGELTPQLVLWEASRESSPLHSMFVWDDSEAADLYRTYQARGLIRRVKVKIVDYRSESEQETRALVHVVRKNEDSQTRSVYLHVKSVLDDADLRNQMLNKAHRELMSFRAKYSVLSELSRLFEAIDSLPQPE